MKVNLDKIKPLIDSRLVNVQKHPTEELYIYNYSQVAQFEGEWTSELRMCRGLILDGEGNIKARPFDKFFNYEQHTGEDSKLEPIPNCSFKAYDKMDGSLGITYQLSNEEWALATRGSFVSDQALIGTEMLRDFLQTHYLEKEYTYLFEIIYPENRIVVDYGDKKFLKLLAMRNIETGEVIPIGEVIKDYKTPRDNAEGVVLYFDNGFMCKVKYEEYVRLHRLVTGVNAKTIWELLKANQPFEELLDRVPDEFYKWVKDTKQNLIDSFEELKMKAERYLSEVEKMETRKDQAIYLQKNAGQVLSVVFAMLDKKDYQSTIWRMIKPKATKPFKEDESN